MNQSIYSVNQIRAIISNEAFKWQLPYIMAINPTEINQCINLIEQHQTDNQDQLSTHLHDNQFYFYTSNPCDLEDQQQKSVICQFTIVEQDHNSAQYPSGRKLHLVNNDQHFFIIAHQPIIPQGELSSKQLQQYDLLIEKIKATILAKIMTPPLDTTHGYQQQHWNSYSLPFNTVNTSVQIDLAREAIKYATGNVLDAGSGPAKLAFYCKNMPRINSYTALDYSSQMVAIGQQNLAKIDRDNFNIVETKIEHFQPINILAYDTVISLNSYYSWPEPEKVLRHIYSLLKDNGILVLATPNQSINMAAIAAHCEEEQASHPHWQAFKQQNLQLVSNPAAQFVSMTTLICQTVKLGFEVELSHQNHYLGGMNFIVLRKNAWYESTNNVANQQSIKPTNTSIAA